MLRRAVWTCIGAWPLAAAGLWRWAPRAAAAYVFSAHAVAFYGTVRANSGLYGPVVRRFAPAGREVWLTIDDGPFSGDTAAMLAVLAEHRAPATFFLEGARVRQAPELARAITAAGHTVGNHSYRHRGAWFWATGPGLAWREIALCNAALADVGATPVGFRAPVGMANGFVHLAARRAALPLIGWSARGFDGLDADPERVIARLLPQVRPGTIIVLHQRPGRVAGDPRNAAILAGVLKALCAGGYRCVLPERARFLVA